jgi:UDP-glucose 4-epimerase
VNILVTGGAGYIGSHTCVELINSGHEIVVVDNFCNSRPEAVSRVKSIAGSDFPFYEMDVRDEEQLGRVMEEHRFDCVIHFAGLKSVGESVAKPIKYYDNNIGSTIALCKAMSKHGVARFVFSSSATVYSGGNVMPLTEDAALGCINPYGWTKLMCERILTDFAAAEDWSVALLRYFNPIGAHESGLIGEDPSDIPNNLLPYISQTAIGRLDKLHVFGDDYDTVDGTGVRDYIHVVDLAKGHVAAVGYCAEHTGVEAVNLGTGRGTSVLQLVAAFERMSGVKVAYDIAPRRAGDLAICYADPSRAQRIFGWSAEKSVDDMCADAWSWQRQNPMGYRE